MTETSHREGPGVVLALLHRAATSTDVLLVPAASAGAVLPMASARDDLSQRQLAEELADAQPLAVERLYASAIDVESGGASFGVFVGFTARSADPSRPEGDWTDLREAAEHVDAPFGPALRRVREAFVARPPDEAFRLR